MVKIQYKSDFLLRSYLAPWCVCLVHGPPGALKPIGLSHTRHYQQSRRGVAKERGRMPP